MIDPAGHAAPPRLVQRQVADGVLSWFILLTCAPTGKAPPALCTSPKSKMKCCKDEKAVGGVPGLKTETLTTSSALSRSLQ